MDQFIEIPVLESLQTDACNICHMTSKCYHLQYGKQCKGASGVLQIKTGQTQG